MKTELHRSDSRGVANHGWLHSRHTFSFAGYHNPERVHFGVLRVLNDDVVKGGHGFGTHPHDNMEIISIPLKGDLEHKDSMGNTTIIREGDVQIMSAGTGVEHSEKNKNLDKEVHFLQIWIFPNQRNIQPQYDQITLREEDVKNQFRLVVSPDQNNGSVKIHQDAYFYLGKWDEGQEDELPISSERNGFYIFVIEGQIEVNDIRLDTRDGLGVSQVSSIVVKSNSDAHFLIMDIPMQLPGQ